MRRKAEPKTHSYPAGGHASPAGKGGALARLAAAGPEQRAVKRWNRQAEKLRNLLSTVRETDVYLGKLDELRNSIAGPEQCQSRLARMCLRQIDAVEERMKQDRKAAARKAADEIKNRLPRFDHLSRELEAELPEPVHRSAEFWNGQGARNDRRPWLSQLSKLNAENLHEFRKQVKKVRYVAEIAAAIRVATRQLSALRRMQSAAGLWHDWQTLAKRAGRTLRGKNKKGPCGIVEHNGRGVSGESS